MSALYGPPGAGKRVLAGELSRIARARGFVPVAARLVGSRQAALWEGRSLFVVADAAEERIWSAFLNAALRSAQSHVLLIVGEEEVRSISGVAIGRVPLEALVSAIRPRPSSARTEAVVRRAAEGALGLPGRFARLLWPLRERHAAPARSARLAALSRVAEQTAVYGGDEAVGDLFDAAARPCAWPAPGELATLRRKMARAQAELARGRQAAGIRQLRKIAGAFARRGAWADAAIGTRALARALLRRGRARDAQAVIEDGREYATRAGDEPVLIDLSILTGEAWIDSGRLDEADSVLGTAVAAARARQDASRVAAASLALARSSYWRGAFGDAEAILSSSPDEEATRVRRDLLAIRIAIGRHDVSGAMARLTTLVEPANPGADPDAPASIAWTKAFTHFSIGDLDAAERDLSAAMALARAARDPQRSIRVRLLRVEVDRARGRMAPALAQLQRLRRLVGTSPVTVRARWDVAVALASSDAGSGDIIARYVAKTGFGALALYVAPPHDGARRAGTSGPSMPGAGPVRSDSGDQFVDELVAILRVCQTASDETELLKQVCARLRQHLHAAAVAFMAVRGERAHLVAGDGARLDTDVAERAAAARILIAPHCHHDRIEAAAPIEYGGAMLGAVCARWTIGSTYDVSRAGAVLAMSAAAAAPMLAAVLVQEARARTGPSELLGITPAMTELRAGVERAAAAPFAVLIDGESGSGKELVARAIHGGSPRVRKPFCTLNCAALPDDLVEAELFGHARGAFTGAVGDRAGVFEEAHGGTLFLDEIGELTPRAQAKILRVIQEGELRRVGENLSRRVDVRIVSATNRTLPAEVAAGRFRLDLLYRLDVVHITVPPLRERRDDIAVLAERFWSDAVARVGSRATLGAATIAALARYDWPGNVRELQNVLAALAVRTPKRGIVPPTALPPCFVPAAAGGTWSLDEARRTFELRFVRAALVRTGGHRGRAAAELGVTRQGLTKLMARLGIEN